MKFFGDVKFVLDTGAIRQIKNEQVLNRLSHQSN